MLSGWRWLKSAPFIYRYIGAPDEKLSMGTGKRKFSCPNYMPYGVLVLMLTLFLSAIFVNQRSTPVWPIFPFSIYLNALNGLELTLPGFSNPCVYDQLLQGIRMDWGNAEQQEANVNGDVRPYLKIQEDMPKNLLAIPVGIKQKANVDQIVQKFPLSNFTIMLFHYDGTVEEWSDLPWSNQSIHIVALHQTKWWFAKRFLHPDIVAQYNYIFIWDEDIGVEHFNPGRYLEIMEEEGLEISQPALDPASPDIHHRITVRNTRARVHRRFYKFRGTWWCTDNSTGPPCTGWVEVMAPVFTKSAWQCAWYMIQNDLIHGWGMDFKLGYCVQGKRSEKVGVIDAEYILHQGIPSLGGPPLNRNVTDLRTEIRKRSHDELEIFAQRWKEAVQKDPSWVDPYPYLNTSEFRVR